VEEESTTTMKTTQTHSLILPAALLMTMMTAPVTHASSIFTFDNDAIGTSTQFTDTANGIAATFSSSGDPGGFAVEPATFFAILTGNVLGDPGPALLQNLSLTINFSSDLSAIDLLFATGDFGPASPFTLTAYEGNALIGSSTSTGTVLSIFPEGEIAFSGPAFNTVVLSSTTSTFAIDNVEVAATPEPGSVGMYLIAGLTLAGVSTIRGRRQALARR
jgi:hypothetical protein